MSKKPRCYLGKIEAKQQKISKFYFVLNFNGASLFIVCFCLDGDDENELKIDIESALCDQQWVSLFKLI